MFPTQIRPLLYSTLKNAPQMMQFTYISLQEMIQKLSMVIAKSFIHDSMTEYPVMKLYPRSKQKVVNISKIANNFINFKNRSDL